MTGESIELLNDYVQKQILEIKPKTVVDFGAGQGKHGGLLRSLLGETCTVIGIDAYAPTINSLKGNDTYEEVILSDLRKWLKLNRTQYDLAIFGDVLEHLPLRHINCVIRLALRQFQHCIINVPLRNVYQEDIGGNPYEIHRAYLIPSDLLKYSSEIQQMHILTARPGYQKLNVWLRRQPRRSISNRGKNLIKYALLRRLGHRAHKWHLT